ncbi:DNA helicase II [Endothiovibrio diazotrophicus]
MDVSYILDPLNDAQREAVSTPAEQALVLAGAGSGKTRVLVHRIAWLVRVEGISPFGILAVTFTNKAAGEMKARTEELLEMPLGAMWIGTFHGLAHRLLRAHWMDVGLQQGFQILDADDQYRTVRRILRTLELDEAQWPPKQAMHFINARKDEGLRPDHIDDRDDPWMRRQIEIYRAYQAYCDSSNVVDFAELLLRAQELLRDHPHVLDHYRARFRHILVDEFQDTNTIQYAWLQLLAGPAGRLFLVGDDDQSIYGWRGAKIENIQRIGHDYPGLHTLRLEQNYRSTSTILNAANALIAHNADRLGKELWTDGEEGEPIRLYSAFNDLDEAGFIVERIRQWGEGGEGYRDAAILYRSNAQSRVLEEALIRAAIPYRIYGGLRFFERAEIKDALAYLRLASNRNDDTSFERVVNTPTRGVGERTVQLVRDHARAYNLPMWEAAIDLIHRKGLSARATNALKGFLDLIYRLWEGFEGIELWEQVEHAIDHSGLLEHYGKEKGDKGRNRIENLEELVTAARQFRYDPLEGEEGLTPLEEFLSHAALEAGEGQGEADSDSVQMMTLHSAKGLEFPLVFICGMEEGLFPHQMSLDQNRGLAEERRLCYVGITRARRQLYLTCAEYRRIHGKEVYPMPSRFLREVPEELIEEIRPKSVVSTPAGGGFGSGYGGGYSTPSLSEGAGGLQLGQHVRHAMFGEGIVVQAEGQGAQARVQVNFEAEGLKWLMLTYAKLETL